MTTTVSEGEKLLEPSSTLAECAVDTGHSPANFPLDYVIHDFPAEVRR